MLGIVGLNHTTAPLSVRQLFYLDENTIRQFLQHAKNHPAFIGMVILSTCNRTEIYYDQSRTCSHARFREVIEMFCSFKELDAKMYYNHFYHHNGDGCTKHLFRVISGMDSLIVGEDQIQGQVKEAYRISVKEDFTDLLLNKLFHKAFETGKKIRNKTNINKGTASIGFAAVQMIRDVFPALKEKTVLLIGAGEVARLMLHSLVCSGVEHIHITNRTLSKAKELAERCNAKVIDYNLFTDILSAYDIVITSTASPDHIIKDSHIRKSIRTRNNNVQVLIDLSVPSNIDAVAGEIENIRFFTIDELKREIDENKQKREREMQKGEKIIDAAVQAYREWLVKLQLNPTIKLMEEKFEQVVEQRLKFVKKKMGSEDFEAVSQSCHYLKQKYVRLIINNLRILSENGKKQEYIEMVNELLELNKR